jgi:hypothetical protein
VSAALPAPAPAPLSFWDVCYYCAINGERKGRPERRVDPSAIPEGNAPSSVGRAGVVVRAWAHRSLGSVALPLLVPAGFLPPHVFPIGASRRCLRLGGLPALCPRCSGKGSGLAALLAGAPLDARPLGSPRAAPGHRSPRLTPPTPAGLFGSSSRGGSDVNSSSSHTLTHAIKSLWFLAFVLEFTRPCTHPWSPLHWLRYW